MKKIYGLAFSLYLPPVISVKSPLSCSFSSFYVQVELDTDRDNFMNAWEAKEYGLVDGVIDDGKPGLVAPFGDSVPPPKTRVWDLWKIEGSRKARKNLPSEHKILENGFTGGRGNDDDRGTVQENESPTPV